MPDGYGTTSAYADRHARKGRTATAGLLLLLCSRARRPLSAHPAESTSTGTCCLRREGPAPAWRSTLAGGAQGARLGGWAPLGLRASRVAGPGLRVREREEAIDSVYVGGLW